jgi:hypothetical protein
MPALLTAFQPSDNLVVNAMHLGGEVPIGGLRPTVAVRVVPRSRLEKVVNKVADNASNLRLKAFACWAWGFHLRPGEGCDGQTEALAGRP